VSAVIRLAFNPNGESIWFLAVMQIVNMVTLLGIVLTGAALIREREHGTIEHLLVMPLTSAEIMLAKVWANALVILLGATFALVVIAQWLLGVPSAGSLWLFVLGLGVYLFALTALGILLATVARTMPQFGLLSIPVFLVMYMLSGANTPLDAMPELLQRVMLMSPTTHFVAYVQSVVFRGAGLDLVWPHLAATLWLGILAFAAALARFRQTVSLTRL
jgi:ABC-2 type transport system permease protein